MKARNPQTISGVRFPWVAPPSPGGRPRREGPYGSDADQIPSDRRSRCAPTRTIPAPPGLSSPAVGKDCRAGRQTALTISPLTSPRVLRWFSSRSNRAPWCQHAPARHRAVSPFPPPSSTCRYVAAEPLPHRIAFPSGRLTLDVSLFRLAGGSSSGRPFVVRRPSATRVESHDRRHLTSPRPGERSQAGHFPAPILAPKLRTAASMRCIGCLREIMSASAGLGPHGHQSPINNLLRGISSPPAGHSSETDQTVLVQSGNGLHEHGQRSSRGRYRGRISSTRRHEIRAAAPPSGQLRGRRLAAPVEVSPGTARPAQSNPLHLPADPAELVGPLRSKFSRTKRRRHRRGRGDTAGAIVLRSATHGIRHSSRAKRKSRSAACSSRSPRWTALCQ